MRGRRQNLQVTRAAFRAEQIYILYLGTTARCERLIAGTTWRQLAGRPAGSTRPSPPARSAPSPARPVSSSPVWFPAPVGANKKDKIQITLPTLEILTKFLNFNVSTDVKGS